jgi:hypothetical protein
MCLHGCRRGQPPQLRGQRARQCAVAKSLQRPVSTRRSATERVTEFPRLPSHTPAREREGEAAHNTVQVEGLLMQFWYSVRSSIRVPLTRMRLPESSRITNTKLTMNSILTRGCAPHHPRRPQRPHQSNARDHRVEVGVRDDH